MHHPANQRKRPAEMSLTPASRERPLELLSNHGRPIRFQMNPAAQHPWPRCFRNAGSEFRDISVGYLYPSPCKAVKPKFRSRSGKELTFNELNRINR